jgi:hypothetical protein
MPFFDHVPGANAVSNSVIIDPGVLEVRRRPQRRLTGCQLAETDQDIKLRGVNGANSLGKTALRAGCSQLARRLSGPSLACVRECAYLTKAEQPGNLRYM